MILSVAVAFPFDASVTLVGLIDQVGQPGHVGGAEVLRLTVPLNPFTLVRWMFDLAGEPWVMVSEEGKAVIVKSDAPDTTVIVTLTEWDSEPLFPKTVTELVPVPVWVPAA